MGEEPKKARGWMDGSTLWRGVALGLLAFAAHLAVDFHLKIPALAMTAAAVLALTVRHTAAQLAKPRTPSAAFRGTQVLFAGSVTGAMLWFVTPHYRAEAERFSVRQEIDRMSKDRPPRDVADAVYLRARDRLTKATRRDSGNPWAWADLAYATALSSLSHPEQALELGRSAEEAARRALAFGPGISEFWVRLGLALDVQDRWVDAGAAFNRALELAPANPWVWYHHAFHLSLHPSTKALARASVATCLRLDPGNREAEALRRNLAAGR